jgi:hypothetical protein
MTGPAVQNKWEAGDRAGTQRSRGAEGFNQNAGEAEEPSPSRRGIRLAESRNACRLPRGGIAAYGGRVMDGGRVSHVRAYGRSMWPFVPPGTTLEVSPLDGRHPRVGEIVVGVRHGRVIAHRVVRIEDPCSGLLVVTRGDAFDVDDAPWRPEELLGVVRQATILGVDVRLDDPRLAALGRWIATHPEAVALVRRAARPLARLGRAAAAAAALAATRLGMLEVEVVVLGRKDERELDRLLLLLQADAAAATAAEGTSLAAELRREGMLGARLHGRLVAAILPARLLRGGTDDAPLLVVHPYVRGTVERPLVDAWLEQGGPAPAPAFPIAEWQRRMYERLGVRTT